MKTRTKPPFENPNVYQQGQGEGRAEYAQYGSSLPFYHASFPRALKVSSRKEDT